MTTQLLVRPHLHQVSPPTRRCALYRQYDDGGVLLYVGISSDVTARRTSHLKHSAWVEFAAIESSVWYDSVTEAAAAEVEAIRTELPLFNAARAVAGREQRLCDYLVDRGAWHLLVQQEIAPPTDAALPEPPSCPWCGCWWHVSHDGSLCESPEHDPVRTQLGAALCRAALRRQRIPTQEASP